MRCGGRCAVDEFAFMIRVLSVLDVPVYVELPTGFETRGLPVLWVQPVAPASRSPALNALGLDRVDVDIDVLASVSQFRQGEASRLAHTVRHKLAAARAGGFRVLDVGRPAPRPDYNPKIRRLGLTATVGVPATTL